MTAQHLAGELFKFMTSAIMLHVPYRGCAPAVADAAAGPGQVSIGPITTVIPFVDAGKIRPLAVTSATRSDLLPDIPTADEAGVKGYRADQWWGLFVPAKTPRENIDDLNASVGKVLHNEELRKKLGALGIEPKVSTPEQFAEIINSDIDQWRKLAQAINLQAD